MRREDADDVSDDNGEHLNERDRARGTRPSGWPPGPWVDTGYLVTNEIGEPLDPDTLSDRRDKLIAAASVRRIRLHDGSHTAGTLMHL